MSCSVSATVGASTKYLGGSNGVVECTDDEADDTIDVPADDAFDDALVVAIEDISDRESAGWYAAMVLVKGSSLSSNFRQSKL